MNVLIRIISVALASALTSNAVVCMDRQEGRNVRQRIDVDCNVLAAVTARRVCYTARRAAEAARKVADDAVRLAVALNAVNDRQSALAAACATHDDVSIYNHTCVHAAALNAAAAADDAATSARNAADDAYEAACFAESYRNDQASACAARSAAQAALIAAANVRDAATAALAAAPVEARNTAADSAVLDARHQARVAEADRVSPEAIARLSPDDFAEAASNEARSACVFAEHASHAARICAVCYYDTMPDSARRVCDAMCDVRVHVIERINPERRLLVSQAQTWACRAARAVLLAEAAVTLLSDDSLDLAPVLRSANDAAQYAIRAYSEAVKCLRLIRKTCKQPLHAGCESAECCAPSLT